MATMYARNTLTTWGASTGVGGFSNTSGGVSNGVVPGGSDSVIFDANSGVARTITLASGDSPNIKGLTTVGSNAMVIAASGGEFITCNDTDVNVSGFASIVRMYVVNTSGAANITLTTGSCVMGDLNLSAAASKSITLGSNVSCGFLSVGGAGTFLSSTFDITSTATFSFNSTITWNMGSGTHTIVGPTGTFNASNVTLVPGTSTIKYTGSSGATMTFMGAGKTFYNLWNARGAGSGPLEITSGAAFNNLKLDPGTTTHLQAGGADTTVVSLTADGGHTAGMITLKSTSNTVAADLVKSGGGTISVNYCSIRDINASPANTFKALKSTNVSNNTNWTFLGGNSNMLSFI